MTDARRTPPPAAAAQPDPGRWEKKLRRALRTGHVCDGTCSATCQPVLIHERTSWGWLAWTIPGDGTLPEIPHQIGVLTPSATGAQRQALRWLTRRPAQRIALGTSRSLRLATVVVALVSLLAGLFALSHGISLDTVLPPMLLMPLLAQHLPHLLDTRAREYVRIAEGDPACRYLQRLTTLHTPLVQAAASSNRYELRRSAELGHTFLWQAAELLQTTDTKSVSARLIDLERLMVQLADQVAQILERTRADPTPNPANQSPRGHGPLGPLPPGFEPATRPTAARPPCTSPLKEPHPMPQHQTGVPARTTGTYLLFAHEPYYPGPGAQEINTTVVAADSLLHPQVQQPDGARIHDLLTRGRTPGEIIPLSTLTHELDGGTLWPQVGDWETVTNDLVHLVRAGECDALSLGLPEIGRALLCAGPHGQVRVVDAASNQVIIYGPQERAAVLAEVDKFLTGLVAERAFWPGDGLLPPIFQQS
ncbi:hypothetical protein SAMN06272735_8953 [Streptomyces sp. TLI_55]|uniref:hypothetical protein n=1 Tax=Streptomyces sp. TLI_55 TaxID=1938861 RepID=UPI000BC4CE48|nr:hypothetical protein [Streptomyces sp. TLI_55]SNX88501.1 hypothetical protein SAMN06272735_8953 [Streptomyces sp. TLI_55]